MYMCDLMRDRETCKSFALLLLREAVELLHLLAHVVDLPLWREIFIESFSLKGQWSRHVVPVWAFMPYDVLARSVDVANNDALEFVALYQYVKRSSMYATAKQRMWEILEVDDRNPRIQRRLPQHLDMRLMLMPPVSTFAPRAKLDAHLRALQQALRTATQFPPHDEALPMRVVASIVTVTLEQDEVDEECLDNLAAPSAATPIGYLKMELKPAESAKGVYPWTTFGKLMYHLALDRDAIDTARHLDVTLADGDLCRFVAVCSAVGESRCIGEFAVYAKDTRWLRDVWLRWLAWSWLSTGENDGGLKMTLNIENVTEDDVVVLQEVLAGGNPLGTTAPPVRWVVATANVVAWCDDDISNETTTIPEGTCVAVVGNDDTDHLELRVLVPGFGIARIAQASTQPLAPRDTAFPRRSRVTALDLYGMGKDASISGTLAFVQLLGGALTSLRIVFHDQHLEQEHVLGILHSCPRLTRLILSASTLATLDFIVDFYNDTTSTLPELILNHVRLTDPSGAMFFFAALATPTSRMAKMLHVAAVGFSDDAQVDASVVEQAFAMLNSNRRLKSVQVRFPERLRPREPRDPESDGARIAQPGSMVSLAQKHALMSALRCGAAGASRALAPDRLALGNVLAFAAEQAVRSALVNFGWGDKAVVLATRVIWKGIVFDGYRLIQF